MTPSTFLARILDPGLEWVATHGAVAQNRAAARPWLLAVAIQETALLERFQITTGSGPGPARSWWQVEAPTIGLLLKHPVSRPRLLAMCQAATVRAEPACIWRAIEGHDALAVGVARLLLLTDPHPVPIGEAEGWATYTRVWRPGKPHPSKWPAAWAAAREACGAAAVALQ